MYTDDNKSKAILYTKQTSTAAITEFLGKIPNRKNEQESMSNKLSFQMFMTPWHHGCYFWNRNQHDILYKKGDKKDITKL